MRWVKIKSFLPLEKQKHGNLELSLEEHSEEHPIISYREFMEGFRIIPLRRLNIFYHVALLIRT